LTAAREIAPAKLNLALHVRRQRPDGRHDIETIFAFCTDGDRLSAESADELSLQVTGPFASELPDLNHNLVLKAAHLLAERAGIRRGAALLLDKRLPVAAGIGGGSADAAAALRLLTAVWAIDPQVAVDVAPNLGSDVPACLLSLPCRGDGAGDQLTPIKDFDAGGTPVLLINPRVQLSTAEVFGGWDGTDIGPLDDWRSGRNDLEAPAIALGPQIETVMAWLATQPGAEFVRMSGSGATCFALFDSEEVRDAASDRVPREWWRLPTFLR
jgi:4-diphosphocytidyl-2-C-methyl-D-erythritol kinase